MNMVFKFVVISLYVFQGFAQEMSGEDFVNQLRQTGKLGIFDTASISVFNNTCSRVNLTGVDNHLNAFCNIVVNSEACKGVEKEDQLNCEKVDESREFNTVDFLAGCAKGLFNSVKELLAFIWDAMKWVFNAVTHPVETANDASEFADSAKLYLTNEYDKAYDDANPPFRKAKALKKMGEALGNMLLKAISEYLYQEYQEFGCMNFRARTETMCFVAGELILPPVVALKLLKYGPKAIKNVSTGLKKFIDGEKKVLALKKRQKLAEDALGRKDLSPEQIEKIEEAHLVGIDEIGKDGGPAGVGNYTLAQIKEKARLLKEAGFSQDEIRKLMEAEVVGVSPGGIRGLFGMKPKPQAPFRSQLSSSGDANVDRFRYAYNNDILSGENQYVSFIDEASGERLPGKIVKDDNGVLTIERVNGEQIILTGEKLDEVRFSRTSQNIFSASDNISGVKLQSSDNIATNNFRNAFNSGKIEGDTQFVSVVDPSGKRVPAKILETSPNGVKVELENGRSVFIDGEDLNNIRVSQSSFDVFNPRVQLNYLDSNPSDRYYNQFRQAFNNDRINNDNQYVSFILDGQRLPGRIVDSNRNGVVIESPGGQRISVEGEGLNDIRVSSTSRETFNKPSTPKPESKPNDNVKPEVNNQQGAYSIPNKPSSPPLVLTASGNRNYDEFRQAFNTGRIDGSNQYVSIPFGENRRPARVLSRSDNNIQLEVLDLNGNHRRVILEGDELNNVRVSSTSRDYFNRNNNGNSPSPSTPGGYNFSSTKLDDYRSTGGDVIEVNLNSPSLRRWMDQATDIIERRTGIKPDPDVNLSPSERNQIYRVWLDEIVGKVEDQNFGNYADARQRLLDQNGGRADLGRILDEQGAVCRELSMFAHVLLSEYGLRSTVMNGIVGTRGNGGGGHAWIQIWDRQGKPLEVLDSNNTRRIHSDMNDYEQSVNGLRMRQTYDLVRPGG